MLIQQGDVLIEKVEIIPEGCKEGVLKGNDMILAEGEVTGHAHRVTYSPGIQFKEKDGVFFIKTEKKLTVRHEEHKPATIPPGIWKVRKVQEFDHFAEEAKNVAD